MKHTFIFSLLALFVCLTACDDGRIYSNVDVDTRGRSAKLTGTISGLSDWADDYYVAVAGFEDGSEYAAISKKVKADNEGNVNLTLTNIPDDVTSVQLCVLDRLRRHVITLQEAEIGGIRDTIRMSVAQLDASMFGTIQAKFLNTTCINCHGASNHSAAGLNLTEGHAFADIVNVDSKRVSGHKIVAPGDDANSVLHQVLNQESVAGVGMNHFDLVSETQSKYILPLIDSWINNGAK